MMKQALLVVLIFSLSACIPTQIIVPKDNSNRIVNLPFDIQELSFADDRGELLPMVWDMPKISVKSNSWKGNPKFTEKQKSDITRLIQRASDSSGEKSKAKFYIKAGECNVAADWKSSQQYVRYKGELVLEILGRQLTYTAWAEQSYDLQNSVATEEGITQVYEIAVRNTIHAIISQIQEQIKQ